MSSLPGKEEFPFIPAARPEFGAQEIAAVARVISSGAVAQGPEVAAFEEEFSAAAVAGSHCVAVNSGTSALHLIAIALGLGPGDEVIMPAFTFAATPNSIAVTGASPVFADIEPDTFTLAPERVLELLSRSTRAIVAVHLYGHPAALVELRRIADANGIHLIEDAAQAHLANYGGRPVGTWGSGAAFSFYPTKNMTSGEGGMVTTLDPGLARQIRLLRNQGQEVRYQNEVVGLNNRMTDIHAAIGRVQLRALTDRTRRRQAIAQFYDGNLRGVVTPKVRPDVSHVYHQYTIRVPGHDRDTFASALADRGVGTGVYYPTPCHRLPPYMNSVADLPQTELAAREVLSLPVYPSLSEEERDRVVAAVNDVAAAGA